MGGWRGTATLRKWVGVLRSRVAAASQPRHSGTTGLGKGSERRKPDSYGTDARRGLGGDRTSVFSVFPRDHSSVFRPAPKIFWNTKMLRPPSPRTPVFSKLRP